MIDASWRWRQAPRWAWPTLLGVIAVYGMLTIGAVQARGNLWHDEAVSTLAATAHLDDWYRLEYEHVPPYGEWVTAAEFQALQSVDRLLPLVAISQGLGRYDVHPPVYFWLYHLALASGLPTLWAGPVLNVALGALLAAMVVRLVMNLTGSLPAALLASAAMLWSPATILAAGEARSYLMYSVATVLLGSAIVAVIGDHERGRTPDRLRLLAVAGTITLGLLTNAQVGLFVLSAAAVIGLRLIRHPRRLAPVAGSFVAGALAAAALFPWMFAQVGRVGVASGEFQVGLIATRLSQWLSRAFDVVSHDLESGTIARIVMRSVVIGVALAVVVGWAPLRRWWSSNPLPSAFIEYAVLAAILLAATYALQSIMVGAVGGHYLVPLWCIVLPAVVVAMVHMSRRWGVIAAGVMALVLLTSSIVWIAGASPASAATRALIAEIADGDAVITGCASRGYFPTVSHALDPETPVWLSTGEDLVAAMNRDWDPPAGTIHLLDARCPGSDDIVGALEDAGFGPVIHVGTLERYQVWRFTVSRG